MTKDTGSIIMLINIARKLLIKALNSPGSPPKIMDLKTEI